MDAARLDLTEVGEQRAEQLVRATDEARVAESSSASETSPGDGLGPVENEVAVFVLEFMQSSLHRGSRGPRLARSRTIAGADASRVDCMPKRLVWAAHARASGLEALACQAPPAPQKRVKQEIKEQKLLMLTPSPRAVGVMPPRLEWRRVYS